MPVQLLFCLIYLRYFVSRLKRPVQFPVQTAEDEIVGKEASRFGRGGAKGAHPRVHMVAISPNPFQVSRVGYHSGLESHGRRAGLLETVDRKQKATITMQRSTHLATIALATSTQCERWPSGANGQALVFTVETYKPTPTYCTQWPDGPRCRA